MVLKNQGDLPVPEPANKATLPSGSELGRFMRGTRKTDPNAPAPVVGMNRAARRAAKKAQKATTLAPPTLMPVVNEPEPEEAEGGPAKTSAITRAAPKPATTQKPKAATQVTKPVAQKPANKPAAQKSAAPQKATPKKAAVQKAAPKKSAAKKSAPKKAASQKAKKPAAKKSAPKKSAAKKPAAKKTAAKRPAKKAGKGVRRR